MASPESVVVVDGMQLAVLDLGVDFIYTIPSFSAIHVSLRQATVQVEMADGSGQSVFDAFMHSHSSLPARASSSPFCITLSKHCFVPVDEFCKGVYVRHLRAVPDKGLLIVWEWASHFESDDEDGDGSYFGDDSRESSSGEESPQSVVDFKCIGVNREPVYQTILGDVRDKMLSGETVPVRLVSEPDNPYDANAIAFECMHSSNWKRIGYVVSEICNEVQQAIDSGDVVSVRFSWVKYKLWKKSSGFYAAIRIQRNGQWLKKLEVHFLSGIANCTGL